MKHVIFTSVCLVLAVTSYSWGASVIIPLEPQHELDTDDSLYVIDIPAPGIQVTEHSAIDLCIENVFDQERYKNWGLTIYIPTNEAPEALNVDYLKYWEANTEPCQGTLLWESQELIPFEKNRPGVTVITGYESFYGDTLEAEWYDYGTQPVGATWGGSRPDIGNPGWVSFHFDVDVPDSTSVFIAIHDECIPEPMTLTLLGLGGLALLRRRKA